MKEKKKNPMGEWWKRMGEKPHGRKGFTKTDRQQAKREVAKFLNAEIDLINENPLH